MAKTKEELATELKELDEKIQKAHFLVLGWVGSVAVFYALWVSYWWWKTNQFGGSPSKGGVVGDFFGGILNPVVSYAAFYWLTKAVRLQKEELAETQIALVEATAAQALQASHAATSVRLNALSTLVDSILAEVNIQRSNLQFLSAQMHGSRRIRDVTGREMNSNEAKELIEMINSRIQKRMTERYEYEQEIAGILATLSQPKAAGSP